MANTKTEAVANTKTKDEAESWLINEDNVCFRDRLERLRWTSSIKPIGDYHAFFGGTYAMYLFREAEYSFVYGQFLVAIMMGQAFLEKTIGSYFYMSGRNDLVNAGFSNLCKHAVKEGLLKVEEFKELEQFRVNRNPLTHFRIPLASDTIEHRSFHKAEHYYETAEEDARRVLMAMMAILGRAKY